MTLNKRNMLRLAALLIIAVLSACSSHSDTKTTNEPLATVSISGSTSVGPLAEKLAETFSETNHVKIEINQIGSSAGIQNAINGVSEIGMSSRDLKEEEKASGLVETIIAYDGIVVITHPSNKVKNLTLEQVKDIFTGKITNWKELGGDDMEIVVVSREEGSGSRDAFQEIVGYSSGELIKNAIIASGNGNIKTTVAGNKHAIGFISFDYVDSNVATVAINGMAATTENVLQKKYPLARPFLFVHKEEHLSPAGKEFIEYILSPDGQAKVAESGAIPIK